MTPANEAALAAAIEKAVRSVPGVTGLYRPRTPGKGPRALSEALASVAQRTPIILERDADGWRVRTSIGVSISERSVPLLRRARQSVIDALEPHGITPAEIWITIAHIDG